MAQSPATRPFGVIVVAVLIVFAAIFNLWMAIWLLMASFGGSVAFTDLSGNSQSISAFYLFVNAALSFIMFLIYMWLMRLTLVGSATAHLIISMFAVINIVFALFRLPYGWGMIVINLIVLLLVNTAKSKAWFSQTA